MDYDDDDAFLYGDGDELIVNTHSPVQPTKPQNGDGTATVEQSSSSSHQQHNDHQDEDEEEEEEDSDEDIEIILDGDPVAPPPPARRPNVAVPVRAPTSPTKPLTAPPSTTDYSPLDRPGVEGTSSAPAAPLTDESALAASTTEAIQIPSEAATTTTDTPVSGLVPRGSLVPLLPAASLPTLDVDAVPKDADGNDLYDIDLESLEDQPWRRPGANMADYFNYGMNEPAWTNYAMKQRRVRGEVEREQGNPFAAFATSDLPTAVSSLQPEHKAMLMATLMGLQPGVPPPPAAMMQMMGMMGAAPPGVGAQGMNPAFMQQQHMAAQQGGGPVGFAQQQGSGFSQGTPGPGQDMSTGAQGGGPMVNGISSGQPNMGAGPGAQFVPPGRGGFGADGIDPNGEGGALISVEGTPEGADGSFGDVSGNFNPAMMQQQQQQQMFMQQQQQQQQQQGMMAAGRGRGGMPIGMRGGRGAGFAARGGRGGLIPGAPGIPTGPRIPSPLPPNVPTGPRNAVAPPRGPRAGVVAAATSYHDKDRQGSTNEDRGLDYGNNGGGGSGTDRSPVTERGSRRRSYSPEGSRSRSPDYSRGSRRAGRRESSRERERERERRSSRREYRSSRYDEEERREEAVSNEEDKTGIKIRGSRAEAGEQSREGSVSRDDEGYRRRSSRYEDSPERESSKRETRRSRRSRRYSDEEDDTEDRDRDRDRDRDDRDSRKRKYEDDYEPRSTRSRA